jgi:hypothetical protein
MPYVAGYLRVRTMPGGGVDNTLPGYEGGTDPGYGIDLGGGVDNTLPPGPPGVFPPLSPSHPIQPAPPGTPPGTIWPPLWASMPHPGHGLPSVPGHPDAGLPPVPGRPDAGLPGVPGHPSGGPVPPGASTKPPSQTYWVVVGIPGVGWRYTAIDPSLEVGGGPVHPGHPDQGLPIPPVRPGTPLPPVPGRPDAGLPTPPVRPGAPLPTPPAPSQPIQTPPPVAGQSPVTPAPTPQQRR